MEILLDIANLELIRKYNDIYDLAGVSTNPTILAKEGAPFYATLEGIRDIIGERQLHVQLTADNCEEMMKEAEAVTARLGMGTYLKVPTNEEGIRTMRNLKRAGYNVTATAIYTPQQAMLASSVGADYVAPYFNRMSNNNFDPVTSITEIVQLFNCFHKDTKVLAASFKNPLQIMQALLAGAHAVTASPELYTMMVETPLIDSAIQGFYKDWVKLYGEKKIYEL